MGVDILMYVEDPGAANFVAGLSRRLASYGMSSRLFATGYGHEQLELLSERSLSVDGIYQPAALLREIKPRALLVGTSENPDSAAHGLVDAAKKMGLRTFAVVDGPANAMDRFRGRTDRPLAYATDYLFVTDNTTAGEYEKLRMPRSRIFVCGHPRYLSVYRAAERLRRKGKHEIRRRLFPDAGRRPLMIFASEISDGLRPEQFKKNSQYTLFGRGGCAGRTEIVMEEFLDASAEVEDGYRVLRLHPKNTVESFKDYLPEFCAVSTGPNLLETLFAADLVVGMTSMVLGEAALLGVPVLSILPRKCEKMWLPEQLTDALACVWTRRDLHWILPKLIQKKTLFTPIKNAPEDALETISQTLASFLKIV